LEAKRSLALTNTNWLKLKTKKGFPKARPKQTLGKPKQTLEKLNQYKNPKQMSKHKFTVIIYKSILEYIYSRVLFVARHCTFATPVISYTRLGLRVMSAQLRRFANVQPTEPSRQNLPIANCYLLISKALALALTPVYSYTRGCARIFGRLTRANRVRHIALTTVLGLALVFTVGSSLFRPVSTAAATADTVNFQARLEGSNGAIALDGNYNVQFKLYNVSSGAQRPVDRE